MEFLPPPSPFRGYHTFAAVRSPEDYDSLRKSFEPVFSEMNELIRDGKVNMNGMSIKLDIVFGGDMKVGITKVDKYTNWF